MTTHGHESSRNRRIFWKLGRTISVAQRAFLARSRQCHCLIRHEGGGCRYFTTMLRVSLRICLIKCSVVLESPNKLYTLNILPENQLCATTSSQYIIKLCSNNLQCSSRTHLRSGVIHSKQKLRYYVKF